MSSIMLMIDQNSSVNVSPSLDMMDVVSDVKNIISPDSPTSCVLDENFEFNTNVDNDDDISDLALAASDQLINLIGKTRLLPSNRKDDDSFQMNEEDTSLVLARNHMSSASFSKWEFDPEDGSFHNSNQLMLFDDDEIENDFHVDGKKRVTFMEDPIDQKKIYCDNIDNSYLLTEQDIANTWYTAADIKKFRQSSHRCAYFARQLSCPEYNNTVLKLHKQCSKSVQATNSNILAYNVAASRNRGLESLIFFELFRKERKSLVQEVIQLQTKVRNETEDENDIMTIIGSFSQMKSRKSRRFAYMVAIGDAEVAQKQYTRLNDMECIIKRTSQSKTVLLNRCKTSSTMNDDCHNSATSITTNTSSDDASYNIVEI